MEKLRIIVGGYIGLYPTGGATWDYIQYPLGLKLLGHDVYYIEDTMQYPVFQKNGSSWDDASRCVSYLKEMMESFGLEDRWAYRDIASGLSFGLSEQRILEICETANVFINISCSTYLRDEYLKIPHRILIDSDPMFTQIQYAIEIKNDSESRNWSTKKMIENHNYLFSFGENIGAEDCEIPTFNYKWHATRQPICLDLWKNNSRVSGKKFTSIMNWSGRKKLEYNNEEWGQKDVEFEKFKQVPALLPGVEFEVVVNKPLNKESNYCGIELEGLGWKILEPSTTVGNTKDYKAFILKSIGEFSVAKETYVKSNSGWFSCRSACYLAAGKPVITEETGWSKYIPSGNGVIAFDNISSAIEALKEINSNLPYHSKQAEQIARAYFSSDVVLLRMLEQLN
ncbi:glycosyltransferase [Segetibacter aerophilus]|uniref:Glycosyl transferase family 1 n=1 Tax=Segetibacter aerophilus TaxID=670293 RepID=A0A512BII4_9BACT|nr:hypothetical protein [Segetibacter aerophilus]GEO11779.1 hypothetical protein SAE01_42750 [Segetibacter aerophilus]